MRLLLVVLMSGSVRLAMLGGKINTVPFSVPPDEEAPHVSVFCVPVGITHEHMNQSLKKMLGTQYVNVVGRM